MHPLVRKVLQTLRQHRMAAPGDRILVAVSGGPDSMALLEVLHELAPRWQWTLAVAHLHHGLRGEDAREDARFVAAEAQKRGCAFYLREVAIPEVAREKGLSLEVAAREVRYAFLEAVAQEADCPRIAVGHTATDQAETLLMRLLRGADLRGLAGIPPVRGRIIRPLLAVTREEVLDYLKARGVPFRVDPTNWAPHTLRNRLRLEWMPWLEAHVNPSLVETLARTAGRFREWAEWLEQEACQRLREAERGRRPGGVVLHRPTLQSLPAPLLRWVLEKAWESIHPSRLQSVHLESMAQAILHGRRGQITLPNGLQMEYDGAEVFLGRRPAPPPVPTPYPLPGPGTYRLPAFGQALEIREVSGAAVPQRPGAGEIWVDGDRFSFPLEVRTRRPGDWFCPLGLGGHRQKLKQFFIDRKVPQRLRDRIPLVVAPEGILWVIGYRHDERFRAMPGSRRVYRIRVWPLEAEKEEKSQESPP